MTHPSFAYDHPLPSLRVTKDFLVSLEEYLVKKVSETSLMSLEEAQAALRIEIDDSLGSERLNSIAQLDASCFSDSTNRIEVELEAPYRKDDRRLRIRLSFSKGRLFSTLAISATAPNARDVVLSLKEGIFRVVDPQRTWHWLFHPNPQTWGVVSVIGIILVYLLIHQDLKGSIFPLTLVTFAFIWFYLFKFGSLRPYIAFDSRASKRYDKIWSWFITGLGTFIFFGTLFTLFRRHIFGF